MHPIVPVIMAFGAILFLAGVIVYTWFGMQRINIVKLRGKEYKLWYFVVVTVGSGVALIMSSVLIQKHFPYQPETNSQSSQSLLSGNLKYELESVLSSMNIDKDVMMTAINRFQVEYQEASQRGDKNTMDLLILEMAYRVRAELVNQNYPENQIEREVGRITNLLKQQPANK
ncbi:MAG: hypothetical protein KA524_01600 [Nitrosomonas sp.]|nr:hypothetical protein [Nitrosomonas sp.]MBP6074898.1 hypothetical protein [Nitrosomonas sp.]